MCCAPNLFDHWILFCQGASYNTERWCSLILLKVLIVTDYVHHWLDGHEFEQALGVGDGQGSLACCSPWGGKESETIERLNWTELIFKFCPLLRKSQSWILVKTITDLIQDQCNREKETSVQNRAQVSVYYIGKWEFTVKEQGRGQLVENC